MNQICHSQPGTLPPMPVKRGKLTIGSFRKGDPTIRPLNPKKRPVDQWPHPAPASHPFHALLPRHQEPLRRFALKLCNNWHRADDLVQATFLKAWTKRDQFRPDTDLRGWLFTILRNTFYSELRKFRREVEDVDGKLTAALFEAPAQEHAVDLARLISAIGTLPAIHRQPLMMVGVYGYSQHEAAKACSCAVGTIKSRLSRGRESLHRSLTPVIMA